jgi:Insertion element 4 transposase N-terminal/Transposase DDE domain
MSAATRDLAALSALPSDERLRALERIVPLSVVQEVLVETGHARRRCSRLPHTFMVFFVIALGLFNNDSHTDVFKRLQRYRKGQTPQRNTIAEARKGLGIAPLRLLADKIVQPLGTPDTPGAFYKGLHLVAIDGFKLDLPDTPANERIFGRPRSGRADGAFPQARVLALCEIGSHAFLHWQVKPLCRGEISMAPVLLRHLQADMLLLWDRGFLSYKNVKQVRDRNAHLLARLKSNLIFKPIEALPDGSYLSKIYPSPWHRQQDRDGIVVRIIEYTLEGSGHADDGKVHRLLTTLLDAEAHPATELIILYHERWEEELAIDELKTHLREKVVLRSQTPGGVIQEIEGLMLAHYAVRALMAEAAEREGLDPDRLSFTGALKILRCRLPEVPKNPRDRAGRKRWWEDLVAEVGEAVLPERRRRTNPRVIKCKMSKWPKKRAHHRRPPKPKPFRQCIVLAT